MWNLEAPPLPACIGPLGTGGDGSRGLSSWAPFWGLAGTRGLRSHLALCFSIWLQAADQDT